MAKKSPQKIPPVKNEEEKSLRCKFAEGFVDNFSATLGKALGWLPVIILAIVFETHLNEISKFILKFIE